MAPYGYGVFDESSAGSPTRARAARPVEDDGIICEASTTRAFGRGRRSRGEDSLFSTELLVQTLISGLMVGILYALMALGITFIYSIVKTINWAMGEFYMIGSYIQYVAVAFLLGPKLWWL